LIAGTLTALLAVSRANGYGSSGAASNNAVCLKSSFKGKREFHTDELQPAFSGKISMLAWRATDTQAARDARYSPGDSQSAGVSVDTCVACHEKQSDGVSALYAKSIHAKSGKSCNSCHGGDPTAPAKDDAHGLNFVGEPSTSQAIRMCGSCHRQEFIQYKASHHFSEDKRVRRADCVECHGAHTVGNRGPDFSYAYSCSGCHGLEYLPGLQEEFQRMLNLSDDLRGSIFALEQSGRGPSNELLERKKEIQRLTGEIVHKTDLKGGSASISHILELGQQLKEMIDRERAVK
ncbi:MAG TPA: multiheme c-type cytochrome, partial [Blastocatellia bacterium]|nr:multiheme c-type cytochrome [Blastocatellia bacterium]